MVEGGMASIVLGTEACGLYYELVSTCRSGTPPPPPATHAVLRCLADLISPHLHSWRGE